MADEFDVCRAPARPRSRQQQHPRNFERRACRKATPQRNAKLKDLQRPQNKVSKQPFAEHAHVRSWWLHHHCQCGIFVVGLVGTQAVLAGDLSAGQLGQAVLYVIIFAGAVAVLGETYGDMLRAAGATERLMELLGSTSPVQSPTHPVPSIPPSSGSTVQFQGLQFHYPSRPSQTALQDFSGGHSGGPNRVALVGPSGAGKTTLFALLLRYYDPQQGRVYWMAFPFKISACTICGSALASCRRSLFYFRAVRLRRFVMASPMPQTKKFALPRWPHLRMNSSSICQRATNSVWANAAFALSGGQRQRIAIARAMLLNPPSLLLQDEATQRTGWLHGERMVQAALESADARPNHLGHCTSLGHGSTSRQNSGARTWPLGRARQACRIGSIGRRLRRLGGASVQCLNRFNDRQSSPKVKRGRPASLSLADPPSSGKSTIAAPSNDLRAQFFKQLHAGHHGARGGNQIVDQQHALACLNGVCVQLYRVAQCRTPDS
jgi:energy-coupling factor transporter ATP-binding protein EcfA2